MKKYIFFAITIFLGLSLSLSAQNRQTKKGNNQSHKAMYSPVDNAERVAVILDLDDKTKAELQKFYEKREVENAKIRAEVRSNNELQRAERRKMMEQKNVESDKELKQILGNKKFELYVAQRTKMQAHRQAMMDKKVASRDSMRNKAPRNSQRNVKRNRQ